MTTLWLTILCPLIGAITNGLFLRKASKTVSHLVGVTAMAVAFGSALVTFWQFYQNDFQSQTFFGFDWISAGSFNAPFKIVLDRLSALMMLVVTGIGTLIHIYAGGYMHEEEKTYRFFTYLNLFVFMMMMLVLGDNLLVMFVGWEGVGLCSYLLIGYWFEDDANAAAGMKAFIANRIGDIGFLLGIFLTYKYFGTVSFTELREIFSAGTIDSIKLTATLWITICLFFGATGKSAQIPLYVWLPDAMAGPTPVSALIHAATMVTAGVYMMTRLNFMFYLSPLTMDIIAFIGGLTAFFAATIAIVQTDIKKVLAYSTVSQLGYMVMAVGCGGFSAGVFHLLTHACFKALLFLGAGSVIVAMHHKQNMFEMGGLKKYMPITHIVMLVAVLAIIGFPGLSGFFSKDEILWKAYLAKGLPFWGLGVVTAGFTAFYMVRLLCLTFYGPNRSDHHTQEHLHETSVVMWGPLVVLAILSATIGYLGVPHILGGHNLFEHYLEPIILIPKQMEEHWNFLNVEHAASMEFGLMGASILVVFLAASFAIYLYASGPRPVLTQWKTKFHGVYDTLYNKYFVDEGYFAAIITPLHEMAGFLWQFIDVQIVDGIVNGVGHFFRFFAALASFKMSGSVQRHATILVAGLVCLLFLLIF